MNVAKHWHGAGRGICHLWLPCLIIPPLLSESLTIKRSVKCSFLPRPEGVARYCFHPVCLSVCVCVCVCLCVCPANILVFYFSAIRRDIDLKFIQDTYRVLLNSQRNIDLHRSKVKVTGTVHCFWRYSHITQTEP